MVAYNLIRMAKQMHRRPNQTLISRPYRLEREWDEAAVGARRTELRRDHFARSLR